MVEQGLPIMDGTLEAAVVLKVLEVLVALVYSSHELVVVLSDDGDRYIMFFIATC